MSNEISQDIVKMISDIRDRPEMFSPVVSYEALCSFILGWDFATNELSSFREWLISKYNGPNNWSWPSLIIFGMNPAIATDSKLEQDIKNDFDTVASFLVQNITQFLREKNSEE